MNKHDICTIFAIVFFVNVIILVLYTYVKDYSKKKNLENFDKNINNNNNHKMQIILSFVYTMGHLILPYLDIFNTYAKLESKQIQAFMEKSGSIIYIKLSEAFDEIKGTPQYNNVKLGLNGLADELLKHLYNFILSTKCNNLIPENQRKIINHFNCSDNLLKTVHNDKTIKNRTFIERNSTLNNY